MIRLFELNQALSKPSISDSLKNSLNIYKTLHSSHLGPQFLKINLRAIRMTYSFLQKRSFNTISKSLESIREI